MKLNREDVIRKCVEIHGDFYDYSKMIFTRAHDKVEIVCPKGHSFFMSPSNHYHSSHPQGCSICSGKGPGKNLGDIFITKARNIFGDTFEYIGEYVDSKTSIEMRCTIHNNYVSQSPVGHLQNKNPCKECYKLKKLAHRPSPYNVTKALRGDFNYPSYIYLIRLHNETESFLKVGVSKNVNRRILEFKTKGYLVDIIFAKYYESCNDAILLEQNIHSSINESRYTPLEIFKGRYECFEEVTLDLILTQLRSNELQP